MGLFSVFCVFWIKQERSRDFLKCMCTDSYMCPQFISWPIEKLKKVYLKSIAHHISDCLNKI